MSAQAKNFWDYIKRSLWLVPLLMTFAGLGLSMAIFQLDRFVWEREVPYLGQSWGVDVSGVRVLFSNISGAIITAMTTILSITLLIFTVLSGQYGAHILRVFKLRLFSKIVIGWFAGTYMYMIYNIYRLTTNNGGYVPQLSVSLGIIFTVVTIFLLILYIHFLVHQIQAGTVVSLIAEELSNGIQSLEKAEPPFRTPPKQKKQGILIGLKTTGYLQSVDKDKLKSIAQEHDICILTHYRTGQFIVSNSPVFEVHGKQEVDSDLIQELRSCVICGNKRIPVEDLECNLELLVEMTLRALSPGVNDLLVAINCLNYIGQSLALLVTRQFPSGVVYDDNGKLLLVAKEFSFKGYVEAALNPLRQYGAEHCAFAIRTLDLLIELVHTTSIGEYRKVLTEHFEAVYRSAVDFHLDPLDQFAFAERRKLFTSRRDSIGVVQTQ